MKNTCAIQFRKTISLTVAILLCFAALWSGVSKAAISDSVTIGFSGSIVLPPPDDTLNVYFTGLNDVTFTGVQPDQTIPQTYPFQSVDSAWTTQYSSDAQIRANNVAERIVSPVGVHIGATDQFVLHEQLKNPSISDGTRRIHVAHLWNPLSTEDIWVEGWIYVPSNFQIMSWNNFIDIVKERRWVSGNLLDDFQIGISLVSTHAPDGSWRFECVVNRASKMPPHPTGAPLEPSIALRTSGGIFLGQWTHFRFHAYRPLEAPDPTLAEAGGYIELWLNDVAQNWLGRDNGINYGTRMNCRTVGELPSTLVQLPCTGGSNSAWFESGFNLYCDQGDPPKEIYYDDLILSTSSQ